MVEFGSPRSAIDHLDALQVLRESDWLFSGLRNRLNYRIFPLISRKYAEEPGHVGKYWDGLGMVIYDLWKDQGVLLIFYLYTYLYR